MYCAQSERQATFTSICTNGQMHGRTDEMGLSTTTFWNYFFKLQVQWINVTNQIFPNFHDNSCLTFYETLVLDSVDMQEKCSLHLKDYCEPFSHKHNLYLPAVEDDRYARVHSSQPTESKLQASHCLRTFTMLWETEVTKIYKQLFSI